MIRTIRVRNIPEIFWLNIVRMYDKDNSGEKYSRNISIQYCMTMTTLVKNFPGKFNLTIDILWNYLQFVGTIEMKEMVEIIGTLYEMEGLQKVYRS